MSSESPPTVVIGAGLAGLAAARHLHAAGRAVRILEASDGVGGRVRSDVVGGFRLDRGFQILLTSYPELERQVDLAALDLRRFEPGALVFTGDRLQPVADPLRRPGRLVDTALAPIGSLFDKARMARLALRLRRTPTPELLRGTDTTTLEALHDEGFGTTMIERLFRPLVGGIQLDPELGASRRMFDTIFKALATGDAAVPAGGMQALPDQLATSLPADTITFGAPVVSVEPGRVVLASGETIDAAAVVVATDGPTAARLLDLPPVASRPATCVWFSAVEAPVQQPAIVLDGVGDGPVRNAAVMTNVAPEYLVDADAADGHRALIAAACPGVADEDVADSARRQLSAIWGRQVADWRVLRVDVIPHGQPGQEPPFAPKQRVDLGGGLFVCGDHRDTASIQGALYSGRRCGEAVKAWLR